MSKREVLEAEKRGSFSDVQRRADQCWRQEVVGCGLQDAGQDYGRLHFLACWARVSGGREHRGVFVPGMCQIIINTEQICRKSALDNSKYCQARPTHTSAQAHEYFMPNYLFNNIVGTMHKASSLCFMFYIYILYFCLIILI